MLSMSSDYLQHNLLSNGLKVVLFFIKTFMLVLHCECLKLRNHCCFCVLFSVSNLTPCMVEIRVSKSV